MKRMAVVTSTRAEYGLLCPVVRQLRMQEGSAFRVELIVSGTHLSGRYGETVSEIEHDGVRIDHAIEVPVESGSELDISKNQADILVRFTELFLQERYDAVILLGDRYETLAIAIAAGNTRTPVFHLCGGDTTEGAKDEWIRHSITKISSLHFPTNAESARRVIQLGEAPECVFNFGSTSIDNIVGIQEMSKQEALDSVGLRDCCYAVCTYHPVTLDDFGVDRQMRHFFKAIRCFPEIEFIVTKSNADQGGERINALLDQEAETARNLHVFHSLGVKRYLSLMRHAEFVLGNSSSGIIEAPALRVPTVNIGDRQKGRLRSESIIDCASDEWSIVEAINIAKSVEFRKICQEMVCPYGNGHAAERIAEKVFEVVMGEGVSLKKKFYDGGMLYEHTGDRIGFYGEEAD